MTHFAFGILLASFFAALPTFSMDKAFDHSHKLVLNSNDISGLTQRLTGYPKKSGSFILDFEVSYSSDGQMLIGETSFCFGDQTIHYDKGYGYENAQKFGDLLKVFLQLSPQGFTVKINDTKAPDTFLLTGITIDKNEGSFDDVKQIIKKTFEPEKEVIFEKNCLLISPQIKKEDYANDQEYYDAIFNAAEKVMKMKNPLPPFFKGGEPYLLKERAWHLETNSPIACAHGINALTYTAYFVDASLAKDRKSLLRLPSVLEVTFKLEKQKERP